MKIIIHTQYKENYGAHDWDGKGTCPQYWKFKGGSVYVVEGVNPNDHMAAKAMMDLEIKPLIEYSDEGSAEFIIDWAFADDDEEHWEHWETPFVIRKDGDKFVASRNVKADDHWTEGYTGKEESYTMLPKGDRDNYVCNYTKTPTTLDIRNLI